MQQWIELVYGIRVLCVQHLTQTSMQENEIIFYRTSKLYLALLSL